MSDETIIRVCHCGLRESPEEVPGSDPRFLELDRVISEHGARPANLIEILHEAQRIFGCVSEDVQRRVAEALEIPLSDVYGVSTFYSLFNLRPAGRFRIQICLGTACYVKGAAELVAALEQALGIKAPGTTEDGMFTVEITRCIGACGLAPVISVGDDVHARVAVESVPSLLELLRHRSETEASRKAPGTRD